MVLRKQESGSNRNQGLREGREVTHTPATALHSHLLARRGPPSGGNPQAHSQGAFTLLSIDLPILGPSQAPQNQSPFKSRGPDPCPQSPGLPPPRTPHEGRTSRVSKQGSEHTAWGGGGDREEGERDPFSSEFPSSLLPLTPFLPSIHPSIHPYIFWWCCCSLFLSRYFLRFFFFSLILYFTDITRIVYSCFLLSACRTYRITHTHPCSWGEVLAGSAPPPPQRGDWTGDRGHLGRPEPRLLPPRLTHPDPHHTQS